MKELERLKKDWNKNQNFPELSKEEIYKFLHKKSSSIVKWIFIISLLEFGFWLMIGLATKNNEAQQRFDSYNVDDIMIPLMVTGYVILIYFFVIFYKNYKEISNTDSTKSLMQKILKTRKTVKHYVIFNLVFLFISSYNDKIVSGGCCKSPSIITIKSFFAFFTPKLIAEPGV